MVKDYLKRLFYGVQQLFFGIGEINKGNQGKINFIDVGSVGRLPQPWLSNSHFIKNALLFEPNESQNLKDNIIKLDVALWKNEEEKDFHVYKNSHGSSLFLQNHEFVENKFDELNTKGNKKLNMSWHKRSKRVKTIKLECTTLDKVLERHNPRDIPFHFLKVDAQGSEYEILLGAKNFINSDNCIGMQLELFNIPMYKGIKLKKEVIDFLDNAGYKILKELPFHGSFLSQNDVVFIKKDIKDQFIPLAELIHRVYK